MYKLYLTKPESGVILNGNGHLHVRGEQLSYQTNFADIESAVAVKDTLLRDVIWGVVTIYDEEFSEETAYYDENIQSHYFAELETRNNYLALPWYKKIFSDKPILKYVRLE